MKMQVMTFRRVTNNASKYEEDTVTATLCAGHGEGSALIVYYESGFGEYKRGQVATLRASGGQCGGGSECLIVDCFGNGQLNEMYPHYGIAGSLDCMHDQQMLVEKTMDKHYVVRRLTPLECCRLQGFPDDWCKDVPGSDSVQYKMWGNGMALPNMLHVMKGIKELVERE